ncbi:hypothetical protein CRG98_043952 [Punica granatum]|uniref:RNase H type-1 domain-containing protein n=1 Tax=Punica granatum TaxID=22663 RepID=A0A2I0HVE1_PUNGR|nr:hypothetical protein CRG98_043952 [Punica granatum]
MAKDCAISNLIVELDAELILSWVWRNSSNKVLMNLIDNCRGLCRHFDVIIPKHTYRAANKCADHLANIGAEQLHDFVTDEDRGHDNEADAHELGSQTREEGADAQDLGGLHVSSGPITQAKARQIQQAMESLLMGFLGQEESNSIGSPKGFIQLTCHEMLKME